MLELRPPSARRLTALALAVLFLGADAPLPAATDSLPHRAALSPSEAALHVLNRLGFGPRPGDLERVLALGVSGYVDQQLYPERLPDAGVETKLAHLPTLAMTTGDLLETYEKPLREARRQRKERLARADKTDKADKPDAQAAPSLAELEEIRQAIPPEKRPRRIVEELTAARIVRAAESQRQLNEVMVDFWLNHFNVDAGKGLDRILVTSYERDVVRPRVWGRFEDLLLATARSPAMLFYLDNARSVADPEHRAPSRRRRAFAFLQAGMTKAAAPTGINENYARELMELHTLGVDGGYTQRDVTELARVLTGWSIDRRSGDFVFRAAMHDVGAKKVLGHDFPPGGGIDEGETMLRLLARQPSTARHIARQLCQRLVADEPPDTLVDRVAKRFLSTGGDLRETVRAIVTDSDFFDPRYFRAKVKSPFEYAVSAVRAVGGSTDGRSIAREIAQMGEPLYRCPPPTGYADEARTWISSGALVARLNFAIALAAGTVPGTQSQIAPLVAVPMGPDRAGSVELLAAVLIGGDLSTETRRAIEQRLDAGPAGEELVAGLILGSPEFQRQ